MKGRTLHYVPVGHNPASAVHGGVLEEHNDRRRRVRRLSDRSSVVHRGEEDISLCHEATLAITDDDDIGVHARAHHHPRVLEGGHGFASQFFPCHHG